MSINQQPVVRTGSLPTRTPDVRQPLRAPQSAQPADAGEGTHEESQPVETAAVAEKPKRKYTRKVKPKLAIGSSGGLSKEERAAWGDIALEAHAQGISVERYMTQIEEQYGLKLAVWNKLRVPAEQPVEQQPETEVAEA